jgi:hypothetical protein
MYLVLDLGFQMQSLHYILEFQRQVGNQAFLHYLIFVQSDVFDVDAASLLLEVSPQIHRIEVLPAYLERYVMQELNHLDLTGAVPMNGSREQVGACELSERQYRHCEDL